MIQQIVDVPLPYDNLKEVRARMEEVAPNLTRYGHVEEANYFAQATILAKVTITSYHTQGVLPVLFPYPFLTTKEVHGYKDE